MSDYDYLNARVRGMSTDLLSGDFYDQVLSTFSESTLMDALRGSAYGPGLQETLSRRGQGSVIHAIEVALRTAVSAAFARILAAASGEPRRLLALQLNRWDVANVVALLRGRHAGVEPHEALTAVLAFGELGENHLRELAAETDAERLADALTTWKQPIGFELRRAILECGAAHQPRVMERALYGAYFAWALAQLREGDPQERIVRESIRRHIDLMNIVAILGQVREKEETPGDLELYERGTLDGKYLRGLRSSETLEDAFESLVGTWLEPGVEKGILTYGQSQSLGVMERFLEAVAVERACRYFREDLLGISVPMGFIWRKYSEYVNLRLLARGALFRMPTSIVRLEMVIV
jgi:vacuolar-type H+-ATPase subunit C/Vma6